MNIQHYQRLIASLRNLPKRKAEAHLRNLCRTDLYFLIRYVLARKDIERQWLFERCQEVQAEPNGYLDLWAREHYKSTIITFGKTIQDILASHGDNPIIDREVTIGIFSHTRPIAKGFLRQIMREFESNDDLKILFPDILYDNPKRQSPKWSEDDGIVVKRNSNPKESTVEAWGLVDSQPTSKHFFIRVYDDVVTIESVRSGDMMKKTTDAWELSLNLGVDGGYERHIGTRYHFNDTYRIIMERKAAIPRIYPATKNGKVDGETVLIDKETLQEKRRKQGPYTFGCQMLQDPKADKTQGFSDEWIQYYQTIDSHHSMNKYIIVDPANEKKKKSDYTAMIVIGAGVDENIYVLDIVRDKLSLNERTSTLFDLRKEWKTEGRELDVYYEKYGKDADIDHIIEVQDREGYRFPIHPVGGQMSKNDRIRRLVPDFEERRIFLPKRKYYSDYEGVARDMVAEFIDEEYMPFPVGAHDDVFDALARIKDISIKYPLVSKPKPKPIPIMKSAWRQ